MIALILALNLLSSSMHVCLGNMSCNEDMKTEVNEKDTNKKHSCCKSSGTEENPSEDKSCKDGCACCFVIQVVILEAIPFNTYNAEISQEQKTWVSNIYSHNFTHLIWHPPRVL